MRRHLTLTLVLLGLVVFASRAEAQMLTADYRVIPLPMSVQTDTLHFFNLQSGMGIAYDASDDEVSRTARFLQQWIEEATGIRLMLTPKDKRAAIRLQIGLDADKKKKGKKAYTNASPLTEQQQEAYVLKVENKGVTLQARQPVGLFRGAQTLRKSLPLVKTNVVLLPYTKIEDEPRFGYRGLLLDCARHFFSVETIKQMLDVMALHGCNQFHWHLTEDQGWRFEVKALPRLALEGSIREQTVIGPNAGIYDGTPYGGYYTQDECREIVRYAAERYINVIPEIDLPGHMQGALHVYPNLGCTGGPYPVRTEWGVSREVLCAGNPETMEFIKTVLGEICDVFPSKFIHIGGDECPKNRWKDCPKCQAKARELGLTYDGKHSVENQLQTYINHEVEKFLNARGRDLIGWDETLEGGLTSGAVVMSWRGVKGGIEAARQGHRVIMSPNVFAYIDHPQLKDVAKQPRTIGGYIVSASKVYSFEPVLPDSLTVEQQQCILGQQVNLWTEYIAYPEFAFYQLLPRLGAASEVQWCRPEQKDWDSFTARLPRLLRLYDRLGVKYCHGLE